MQAETNEGSVMYLKSHTKGIFQEQKNILISRFRSQTNNNVFRCIRNNKLMPLKQTNHINYFSNRTQYSIMNCRPQQPQNNTISIDQKMNWVSLLSNKKKCLACLVHAIVRQNLEQMFSEILELVSKCCKQKQLKSCASHNSVQILQMLDNTLNISIKLLSSDISIPSIFDSIHQLLQHGFSLLYPPSIISLGVIIEKAVQNLIILCNNENRENKIKIDSIIRILKYIVTVYNKDSAAFITQFNIFQVFGELLTMKLPIITKHSILRIMKIIIKGEHMDDWVQQMEFCQNGIKMLAESNSDYILGELHDLLWVLVSKWNRRPREINQEAESQEIFMREIQELFLRIRKPFEPAMPQE